MTSPLRLRPLVARPPTAGLVALLAVCATGTVRGQCPDGTPPPCGARAPRAAAPAANSVAVLYFDNVSRDSDDAYLADGLTEEIINRLSAIARLDVRSRYVVRRLRGHEAADPATLGRVLHVAYLVSGGITRLGQHLRVSAELVRAASGAQVWGRQFDAVGGDVLGIQDTVAREVTVGIIGRLLPSEQRAVAAAPTRDPAAYDHVLRGNFYLARRDSAGYVRAIREYRAALATDPASVVARARLAFTYGVSAATGTPIGIPMDSARARATAEADDALRRNAASAEAWLAKAMAGFGRDRQSGAYFRHALALDPANAEAHATYGIHLWSASLLDSAEAEVRRAVAMDPSFPVSLMQLGAVLSSRGRAREAVTWLDSALAIDPDFYYAHLRRVVALAYLRDTLRLRAEATADVARPALRSLGNLVDAWLAWTPGDSVAQARLRSSFAAADVCRTPSRVSAVVLPALRNDAETVLACLEQVRPRGPFLGAELRQPALDPFRSDPRFAHVAAESGPNEP